MFVLGKRSRERLIGVHPDLVIVMSFAIYETDMDFAVIEGLRTLKRQKELLAQGASKTLKSRHLTGHAVDIAPYINGEIRWDWPLYEHLGKVVKKAAKECKVNVEWGGDWKTFRDGPHWQLPWKEYPK
jgi:peptidoglycan L-alanyl-D-glutamate endopeptidase CwlK